MEQFIVSARKYRPQTFGDVVGQQAITNTLVNAIDTNHLAQALLFTGPRGVGKTTCARILARKINQPGYDDPTEDFAFNVFELDAASNNSVDDIRSLIDQVRIPPQTGKYKVYIIDEVHMLSSSAFNAFLKTLEEPPAHAIFILATTEKHKIIPTILSRCQIFDFKRITISDAAAHLALVAQNQNIAYEPDALRIIAQKADGAMRDALSIFDRVVSYCGRNLTRAAVAENLNVLDFEYYIHITDLILNGHIPGLLSSYDDILAKGFDGHHFIGGLASHFRNLMVVQTPETVNLLEVGEHGRQLYINQAMRVSMAQLIQGINLANDCDLKYKSSQNQRLLVELCLMQLASLFIEDEKKKASSGIVSAHGLAENLKKVPQSVAYEFTNSRAQVGLSPAPGEQKMVVPPMEQPAIQEQEITVTSARVHVQQVEAVNIQELPAQKQGSIVDEIAGEAVDQIQTLDPNQSDLFASEPQQNVPVEQVHHQHSEVKEVVAEKITGPGVPVAAKKINALSLSSIQKRKELENSLEKKVVNLQDLPKDDFTVDQFKQAWDLYAERLARNGLMLMSSLMGMTKPVVQGTKIVIELPNQGSKVSFDEGTFNLMQHLRKTLNNYDLELVIHVNEQIKLVKQVMDDKDKYRHFTEMNNQVDILRQTFDLELR